MVCWRVCLCKKCYFGNILDEHHFYKQICFKYTFLKLLYVLSIIKLIFKHLIFIFIIYFLTHMFVFFENLK